MQNIEIFTTPKSVAINIKVWKEKRMRGFGNIKSIGKNFPELKLRPEEERAEGLTMDS